MSKIIPHPASIKKVFKNPVVNFLIFISMATLSPVIFFMNGFSREEVKSPAGILLLISLFSISLALHFLRKKFPD